MRRAGSILGALVVACCITPLAGQQTTGTIRGRVTDSTTQQPLSGATITVGNRGVLTQADGHYLITGVPSGTDSVRARMLGYAPGARPVTVAGGDTVVVDKNVETRVGSVFD